MNHPPLKIIALTGLKGTGKDTIADFLVADYGFKKMAFADALYREIAEAFNVDVETLQRRETKEHPMSALAINKCLSGDFTVCVAHHLMATGGIVDLAAPRSPRQILQMWGTAYRRAQNADYWTNKTKEAIALHLVISRLTLPPIVLTDLRFPNEAGLVRQASGQIWQVRWPEIEVKTDTHVSETTGQEFEPDVRVYNTANLETLRGVIGAIMGRTREEYWLRSPKFIYQSTGDVRALDAGDRRFWPVKGASA